MATAAHEPPVLEGDRVAVIDIGSNSVRLVVYDGPSPLAQPVFNEKVLVGLGADQDAEGRLSPARMATALDCLTRYAALIRAMRVDRVHVLATAATRDAPNGPMFVDRIQSVVGAPVRLLSGEEEGRLSAQGVLAGIPGAEGTVGDLGGGSLELAAIDGETTGAVTTLPLGPLRLANLADGDPADAREVANAALASVHWLVDRRGLPFYPVGGAWRAFARVHMARSGHPLRIIHNYSIALDEARDLLAEIASLKSKDLARLPDMPRRRVEAAPYAALVLDRLLEVLAPPRVVFSAFGLREGSLWDALPPVERPDDPLLAGCADIARRHGRCPDVGAALAAWTAPLFPRESAAAHRLRLAACLIGDVGWREHPEYRAGHAAREVLHGPLIGLEHSGRAFLALALLARYGGNRAQAEAEPWAALLPDAETRDRAWVLGLALRLGLTLSGGERSILVESALHLGGKALVLELPAGAVALAGETVLRRLDQLALALGVQSEVATATGLRTPTPLAQA